METVRQKIMIIVGARPQFIKAAMISRAVEHWNNSKGPLYFQQEIVHTGQHYDYDMCQVFFDQLNLPAPKAHFNCGGGSHGEMTGNMIINLEKWMLLNPPDLVMVFGDTNSTLAGALTAVKLGLPVAHVEAGLRSFNLAMPEEINRKITDHISKWLFCPTLTAVANLAAEGVTQGVFHCGDVMYDAALHFAERGSSDILSRLGLTPGEFVLVTIHRQENAGSTERLSGILEGLRRLARMGLKIVWPLHPRMNGFVLGQARDENWLLLPPLPFLDMPPLLRQAKVVLTDSGGLQKEAYFHGVPCVTLRDETEWTETVSSNWNQLAGWRPEKIVECCQSARGGGYIKDYGSGQAARKIIFQLAHDIKQEGSGQRLTGLPNQVGPASSACPPG